MVFDKQWFQKHNKTLCWLANHPILKYWFRRLLRIENDIDWNEKILTIAPNHFTWDAKLQYFNRSALLKTQSENPNETRLNRRLARKILEKIEKGKIKDRKYLLPAQKMDVRTNDKFARRLYFGLKPLWYILHFLDFIFIDWINPEWGFGFSTLTKYPDGPGGSTCSGQVAYLPAGDTWANVRGGAGNYHYGDQEETTGVMQYVGFSEVSSSFDSLWRFIETFDTSALTSGATISDVVASNYGGAKTDDNSKSPDISVYGATPASNAALANGDYAQCGSTAFATAITYSNWNTGGYNDFTFNATGRAAVSKTGITPLSLRNANYDVANTNPVVGSNGDAVIRGFYASYTGTDQDPKLVITYTTVVAPTVTTQDADLIKVSSVRGNGNITVTGGANATRRGFAYKLASSGGDPVITDSVAYDDGDYGTGAYTKVISGLTANTEYKVRAYATNSAGTGYGSTVTVTTQPNTKVLTSVIKTNSALGPKNIGKMLIQVALIGTIFAKISSISKTISETVKINAGVFFGYGIQFLNSLAVNVNSLLRQSGKLLNSTVLVNSTFARKITGFRTLVQTAYVHAEKESFRAFTYTQRVVARTGTLIILPTKMLIARIIGRDTAEFNHIFTNTLTDAVIAVDDFTFSIAKLFSEVIKAGTTLLKYSPKVFSEVAGSADSLIVLSGKWFPESFGVVGEMANFAIAKLLIETPKFISEAIRASVGMFLETVKVSAILIWLPTKLILESVAIGSIFILGTIAKVLIGTVKAVGNVFPLHTYFKTISEVVSASASALKEKILILLESVASGTTFILGTISKVFVETFKAIEDFNIILVIIIYFNETVKTGAEALTQGVKIFVEVVGVLSEYILGTINKVMVEVSKVNDVILKSLPKVFSQTILVSSLGLAQGLKVLSASVALSATFILGTISKVFIEPVKAIEVYLQNWESYKVFTQVVGVVSIYSNQGLKLFAEGVGVGIAFFSGVLVKLLNEIVNISFTIIKTLPLSFSEVSKVAANAITKAVLVFTGSVGVAVLMVNSLAKTLTETAKLSWAKIKLVLNGITAGSWSRRARITGPWKRKSRNETL